MLKKIKLLQLYANLSLLRNTFLDTKKLKKKSIISIPIIHPLNSVTHTLGSVCRVPFGLVTLKSYLVLFVLQSYRALRIIKSIY